MPMSSSSPNGAPDGARLEAYDTEPPDQFALSAHELAARHTVAARLISRPGFLDRLQVQETLLHRAYQHFERSAEDRFAFSYGAEWLLDNFYLVQQALRQVHEDLPVSYYRQLPKLSVSPLEGYPRIYGVAAAVIQSSTARLDIDAVRRFVRAYQDVTPLTMRELWALPAMLRLGILEVLTHAVASITKLRAATDNAEFLSVLLPEAVADEEIVAASVSSLRTLATEDWKAFFESVSRVEQILQRDPADVYGRMDFTTRNRYRSVIETLALATGQDEEVIAERAIRLAASQGRRRTPAGELPQDGLPANGRERSGETKLHERSRVRMSHVGFYLVDAGRRDLEADLGYRPPAGERMRRWLFNLSTSAYLGAVALLTLAILLGLIRVGRSAGADLNQLIGLGVVALVPVLTVVVELVNWLVTHIVPPRVLPKLDFKDGIPPECRTMIVIPALLTEGDEIDSLLRQLELHFLGNSDPYLHFALLTDFLDGPDEHMPGDDDLLEQAATGVQALNEKYRTPSGGPFYLFHRKRRWNPIERCWMGWERKRGKLAEFNRLLLGKNETTAYTLQLGDLSILPKVRYVITLDADTSLPRESARHLIGTLAHPLNRAECDPDRGIIIAGYTLLQPRVEISPTSANRSLFTRVYSKATGVDLYTQAVSDVYQDLFGEGIYVGKGIYDVAAFEWCLNGRAPENALLSHDLFEGIHGRAGLVTDVVVFEEYPPHYLAYTQRLHRWIRGDWQLLPWLLPRVPHAGSGKARNILSVLDRWKILDNLRRSAFAPTLLLFFLSAWLWLPGSVLVWTAAALLAPAFPLITGGAVRLDGRRGLSVPYLTESARGSAVRWFLTLVFLPYEALVALHAIGSTISRITVTRRHLLQWTAFAHSVRLFDPDAGPVPFWREMRSAPLLTTGLVALIALMNPSALPVAGPLVLAWLISPQMAYWISRPLAREPLPLAAEQREQLRCLARRTWLYFERFVGPDDHWLPPDHFQEAPRGLVAHRTSPTNIGLLLLSTIAAYDLGYIGFLGLASRLHDTFDTLDTLERHWGHFLNWYNTLDLQPLAPRYVSTVDSGNLAACLIALRQGCLTLGSDPVLPWTRWEGFLDLVAILAETVDGLDGDDRDTVLRRVQAQLARLREQVVAAHNMPGEWASILSRVHDDELPELDRLLISLVERGAPAFGVEVLRSLQDWTERLHHHISTMQRQVNLLAPWLSFLSRPPALLSGEGIDRQIDSAWKAILEAFPMVPRLCEVPEICRVGQECLAELREALSIDTTTPPDLLHEARGWCERLAGEISAAQEQATTLLNDYYTISAHADTYVSAMDFRFLFDHRRRVFHIGYNVEEELLDSHHYDLLASEARTASLVAIAKGDVPQSHWLYLARPVGEVDGKRTLLSWGGSMFEYLMPALIMKNEEGSLLGQSCRAAVDCQISYGRRNGVPWGISESGFYRFDLNQNYQYQAFGVPGLGFKRSLGTNLVISPYASLLALDIRPHAVMRNIADLIEAQALGQYGFYETIDYTQSRLPLGQKQAIVSSYMAHHQGMILLALTNSLRDHVFVRRFHADPRVQSVELLLYEQVPVTAPLERPPSPAIPPARPLLLPLAVEPWRVPVEAPLPPVHVLSNGRYRLVLTSAGSGVSCWQGVDLTRWRADTTLDDWGTWIYVQDSENGALWSAGYQPTGVVPENEEVFFSAHKAEFFRRDHGIFLHVEITVAPDDDVEIRRVTLTNTGDTPRRLALTSYAEVVLASRAADQRHPAFNKLFIESEYLPGPNALLFHRRLRSPEEEPVYLAHMLVMARGSEGTGGYESDRSRFLGRGRTPRRPEALVGDGGRLSGTTGATLDPIMALGQELELEAHATATVAFCTLAAGSRRRALSLVERYRGWSAIDQAFTHARVRTEFALRRLEFTGSELARNEELLAPLLYPHPALRSSPSTLAANFKGQSGLWPYGISGDEPILLVRVGDAEGLDLIWELLRAHEYWRKQDLKIDLVILNRQATGYFQELDTQLRQLISRANGDAWLNQRGGIFLLRADQLGEADLVLLETAARAILDGEKGSLADQLEPLHQQPARLPPLISIVPDLEAIEPTPPLLRPTDLLFDNGRGGFSPDGREYVIYLEPDQQTPLPWINVIANPRFGFLVSEVGGGYTWGEHSGENRLTPWRNDPVTDLPAEVLYLRDEESGQVWSATPLPAGAPAPYLIRHGAGYSIFEHHSHGLKQRLRLFAIPDEPLKLAVLRLENTRNRTRRITATYYAEWVLGPLRDSMQQYVVPEFDDESQALLATNRYNAEFGGRVAFLAANKRPHGVTTGRIEFLGRMGRHSHPAALDRIGLSGAVQAGVDPCAAMQLHVDLAAGGSEEVFFLVGQGADREEVRRLVARYRETTDVENAWKAVGESWENLLGRVTVQTPDLAMNLLLNRWLLYQTLSCRVWGRSALYQSSGAFGYRDQLQDVTALLHTRPDIAREHILRAARHQFADGDVLHWWHPHSGRGVRTRISDDLLWLPFVTAHYVTVTGDESLLAERVPFLMGEPLKRGEQERYGLYETSVESASLYEHCRRALEKATTAGPHGLPLIGSGDWNDGLNRVGIGGRGESVWLGWFLYAALTRFSPLCERLGDAEQAARYLQQAGELRDRLEAAAWDGEWYLRGCYDDGAPLGSALNRECQIDSLAQSWAVLSSGAKPWRAAQAMEAVAERLVKWDDQLLLLFTPPFDMTVRDPGYIKAYPPGIRENGGQYTHAALWTVWAFAELGDGDRAEALFRLLNPIYHASILEQADRYWVEPYVVAADISSSPTSRGRGGWTWYTGSAGWMHRLGLEAILGIRRIGTMLRIDPCIPRHWERYDLTYRDGATTYEIHVANPNGVNRGVKQVVLDGANLPERSIPLLSDGGRHAVQVLMGEAADD